MKTNVQCAIEALEETKTFMLSESFGSQVVRNKVELALSRLKRERAKTEPSAEDWALIITALVYISDHALEGWAFEERARCLEIAGRLRTKFNVEGRI